MTILARSISMRSFPGNNSKMTLKRVESHLTNQPHPRASAVIQRHCYSALPKDDQKKTQQLSVKSTSKITRQRSFHSSSQVQQEQQQQPYVQTPTKTAGPAALYANLVKLKQIQEDVAQREVMTHLDHVFSQVLKVKDQMEPENQQLSQHMTSSNAKAKSASTAEHLKPKSSMSWLEKWAPSLLLSGVATSEDDNQSLRADIKAPRGMYIYGGPGSGKTFCMDQFFSALPIKRKRRVHFHEFMLEFHRLLHHLKQSGKANSGDEMMAQCVDLVHERSWVLCFDEFQVTDIADAMVLRVLFEALWAKGTVVIITSNREPDELYKNGIQRHLFLPFIDSLKLNCRVEIMQSNVDYRMLDTDEEDDFDSPVKEDIISNASTKEDNSNSTDDSRTNEQATDSANTSMHTESKRGKKVYFVTGKKFRQTSSSGNVKTILTDNANNVKDNGNNVTTMSTDNVDNVNSVPNKKRAKPAGGMYMLAQFEQVFDKLCKGTVVTDLQLRMQGRVLHVPQAGKHTDVARFTFNDLCGKPLGAADYYAIASTFHTLFLEDVPQLELHQINHIRRFITLVDTLYDQHVVLVMAAQVPLHQLLLVDKGNNSDDKNGNSSLANIDEVFAFDRTLSRLHEMQKPQYLQQAHRSLRHVGPSPVRFLSHLLGDITTTKVPLDHGDIRRLWDRYDMNDDGKIDVGELETMLKEIMLFRTGHVLVTPDVVEETRRAMAGGDHDNHITWDRFQKYMEEFGTSVF